MSKETTESIGVNLLKNLFLSTEKVNTENINSGEKGVSWDGFIDVFKDKKCKKTDFIGKIPLQIKTIKSNGKTKNFPISKFDMENYKKEKRIIFFYIRESSDCHFSYYYLPLQLWDIENCLKKYGNKKTRSFEFESFPEDSTLIYNILINFIDDFDKRNITMPNIGSIDELIKQKGNNVELSFVVKCHKNATYSNLIKAIREQRPYLTYNCKDSGIDATVDRLCKNHERLSFQKRVSISIDGVVYFEDALISFTEDSTNLIVNNNLTVFISHNYFNFRFNFSKDIDDRLITAKFLKDLVNKEHFSIDKNVITINDPSLEQVKNMVDEEYDIYFKLSQVIKTLSINKKPSFDNISNVDIDYLNIVYNSLIKLKPFKLKEYKYNYGYFKMFGLVAFVNVEPVENGYIIHNWHEGKITLTNPNDEEFVTSSAYFLSNPYENILSGIDNVDYEELTKTFISPNQNELNLLSWVVINLISHFDKTKDSRPLLSAKKICESLLSSKMFDVSTIVNLSQIYSRLNERLPIKYVNQLKRMSTLFKENHMTMFCINAALNMFEQAKKELDMCNEEDRTKIYKWPIYTHFINKKEP